MSTELERVRSFDLTRSPSEQWNEEMLQLVSATVLKGSATRSEQFFCLAVADSLNLNPFIDEIYFIKVKSRDGGGKIFKPYIGRNGLVAKATERGAYYQAAEVHENDLFEVETTTTGRVKLRHKFTQKDRGAVVGAYAFLHGPWRLPAFAYIDIGEYKPEFDEQWKREASPWYNQESAMAQKCAMIVAGRTRLQLGNVLADGEIERVEQQNAITSPGRVLAPAAEAASFDLDELGSPPVVARLREAFARANSLSAEAWTPAKIEMVTAGMGDQELGDLAERVETDNAAADAAMAPVEAGEYPDGGPSPGDEPHGTAGDVIEGDAVVIPPLTAEQEARAEVLQLRIGQLHDQLADSDDPDECEQLEEEIAKVGAELGALSNPAQGELL